MTLSLIKIKQDTACQRNRHLKVTSFVSVSYTLNASVTTTSHSRVYSQWQALTGASNSCTHDNLTHTHLPWPTFHDLTDIQDGHNITPILQSLIPNSLSYTSYQHTSYFELPRIHFLENQFNDSGTCVQTWERYYAHFYQLPLPTQQKIKYAYYGTHNLPCRQLLDLYASIYFWVFLHYCHCMCD
jgi:hypothetical protein